MGQSTNAYLFYGYCWDDEEGPEDAITNMDEWSERVLAARGHANPWDSHPGGFSPEWMAANDQAIDDWSDLQKSVQAEAGVNWGRHCSGEYPMRFLHIPESKFTAYCGDMQPITSLAIGDDWNARLAAHMEAQGAVSPDGENQPGWWLVSYWG
jgi:hypothetical protein